MKMPNLKKLTDQQLSDLLVELEANRSVDSIPESVRNDLNVKKYKKFNPAGFMVSYWVRDNDGNWVTFDKLMADSNASGVK